VFRIRRGQRPLSETFLREFTQSLGRPPAGISREAGNALVAYGWPGNVRELRNMLERAAILCEGGLVTGEHLRFAAARTTTPVPDVAGAQSPSPSVAGSTDLRTMERSAIERALIDARHNKSLAAKNLGLSRKQLYARLRRHGLD
jgi:DNA-binding NtrC family response regulator